MENKGPIIISIISLIIALVSLSHSILIKEYGLVIGKTEYKIEPSENMKIENSIKSLQVAPIIDIANNGTLPVSITKIKGFIKFNNSHHIFTTMQTYSVDPSTRLKKSICLYEEYPDSDQMAKDLLASKILYDLQSTYYETKGEVQPIFLSESLYGELGINLEKQVDWMLADDDYYFLLMLWINSNETEPNVKKLYKFELIKHQLDILTEYQIHGLKTPSIIKGNLSATYRATPRLEYINDSDQTATVYSAYKRYAVTTD